MKNYLNSKKTILSAFVLMAALTIGVYIVFETKCFGSGCNPETRESVILPLFWFGVPASVISAFFLFFSQAVFVSFLKRVVSWYLPILFVLTVTTPVSSSHIMSVERAELVFSGMVILGLIAIVYAFVMRKRV